MGLPFQLTRLSILMIFPALSICRGNYGLPRNFIEGCLAAGVPCVTDPDEVMCGDGDAIHIDLFDARTRVLTNVVLASGTDVTRLPGFCLAADVDLSSIKLVGFWDEWYIDDSAVAGVGLFTREHLPAGTCLGRIARVYTSRYFNDWGAGRLLYHGGAERENLLLVGRIDHAQHMLPLFGLTTRDVAEGEELLADYSAPESPGPNHFKPTGTSASWPAEW